jgi:cytochrome c oxidase cbb3-type subunit 3
MRQQRVLVALAVFLVLACIACNSAPGRPGPHSQVIPPSDVMDFEILYAGNCAGCHGHNGKGGAAIGLGDPIFLAIADDNMIRSAASNGIPGTPMPAFARSAGGMLTDRQIDAIAGGIRSWAKPAAFRGAILPSYIAVSPGDPDHGAEVYVTFCSACHGPGGRGGEKASSIVDGSYLALVSDQDLRTTVIVGRPDLGAPDWRNNVPGRPMSGKDISDVVAWLAAQRPQFPGQPYSSPYVTSRRE